MENWTTGFYVIDEWKEIGVGEKRDRLLVIGYWLSVIGYRLLVIGYWLLVISYQTDIVFIQKATRLPK